VDPNDDFKPISKGMSTKLMIQRLSGFGRGKMEDFFGEQILLGTSANCHVRFDPTWDKTVSPEHAVLSLRPDGWWLEDKSRDGCWVDGRRISQLKIFPGIVITLGVGGPKILVDFEGLTEPGSTKERARTQPEEASLLVAAALPARATPRRWKWRWLLLGSGSIAAIVVVALVLRHQASGPRVAALQQTAVSQQVTHPENKISDSGPGFSQDTNASQQIAAIENKVNDLAGKLERQKDTDRQFAEAAKRYEDAVGLVVARIVKEGKVVAAAHATAWAVGDKVFVSNSHVSEAVSDFMAKGGFAFIILNQHPDEKFEITQALVHPKYGKKINHLPVQEPAVGPYDVGLLKVNRTVPNKFALATEAELKQLDSGYRVAYLGFPMERLQGSGKAMELLGVGGVDLSSPVANMQSGIITSVTDYWLSKAPYDQRLLLQHNLGATGGASGSPIFNSAGHVVGVLSGINTIGQIVKTYSGGVGIARAPSAVMINFAQRIDLLRDIYPEYGE
jgi:pSer/pThr/pTyr-binding forkhead associated (FHA) protein